MRLTDFLKLVPAVMLGGCITASIEDDRAETTGLLDGETVVVMAKSYHQGNETEADYIRCVEKALQRGSGALRGGVRDGSRCLRRTRSR